VAVLRGASIVRTHDVRATADFLRVLAATADAAREGSARGAIAEGGR
jgi:dihydropteroate synthase